MEPTTSSLTAPPFYARLPGDADRVYAALCGALAGRAVDWGALTGEDWGLLAHMAHPNREGVGPLLYNLWQENGWPELVPEAVRKGLEKGYYMTLATNSLLFRELDTLLDGISGKGIPVILLKGAAIAGPLYHDIGLRPMHDLDILVRKEDLAVIVEHARAMGFEENLPKASLKLDGMLSHHVGMRKAYKRDIALEIHHSLVGTEALRLSAPVDWFLGEVEPVGEKFGALNFKPEAQLLHLSAHAVYQHKGFSRLIWLFDIDRLLRKAGRGMDWDKVFESARNLKWQAILGEALWAVVVRFGTPLPETVMASEVYQNGTRTDGRRMPSTRSEFALQRLAELDPRARWELVRSMLLPRPAYMIRRYAPNPKWLWPLTYPYRWADIAWDWFKSLTSRWRPVE